MKLYLENQNVPSRPNKLPGFRSDDNLFMERLSCKLFWGIPREGEILERWGIASLPGFSGESGGKFGGTTEDKCLR